MPSAHPGREVLNTVLQALRPHAETVRGDPFLALVDGPWDVANGLITPTLKLKRNALEQRYASRVDGWITAQNPVIWARGL